MNREPSPGEAQGLPDPAMIILAREAKGMTQTSLARELKVGQGTISKVESGQLPAGPGLVAELAEVLERPKAFFYQRLSHRNLPVTFFRKKKTKLTKTFIRTTTARINILRLGLRSLLRSVEIPDPAVPEVDLQAFRGTAEDVARDLRIKWHLPPGPVEDLTGLLEKKGIVVVHYDFGTERIDGLSIHEPDDGLPPLIVVRQDLPGDRLRWTLAHELAHIVLHHHLPLPSHECEPEADAFASAFLLPADDIRGFLGRPNLEKLAHLKSRWKVSIAALIMRSAALGQIGDRRKRQLFMQMNRYGFHRREPVTIRQEQPKVLRQIIQTHSGDLGYSESELADLLFVLVPELRARYRPEETPRGLRLV